MKKGFLVKFLGIFLFFAVLLTVLTNVPVVGLPVARWTDRFLRNVWPEVQGSGAWAALGWVLDKALKVAGVVFMAPVFWSVAFIWGRVLGQSSNPFMFGWPSDLLNPRSYG